MNTISLFQSLLCSWSSEKCIHNQQHFGECMYVGFTIKARGNWHGIKIEAVAPNPNVLPLNSQDAVIHEFHIDSWSYTIVNLTKFIWRSPQVCSSWLSARSTRIIKGSQDHGAWNGAPSSRRAVGIVRKMWIGIRESGKRRNINVNATGLEKARMRIAGWEEVLKRHVGKKRRRYDSRSRMLARQYPPVSAHRENREVSTWKYLLQRRFIFHLDSAVRLLLIAYPA